MKSGKLSEYSVAELVAKRKKTKMVFSILGGLMLVAVPALCYAAYTTKNFAFFVVGMGGLTPFASGLIYLSQIDKEIKSRN